MKQQRTVFMLFSSFLTVLTAGCALDLKGHYQGDHGIEEGPEAREDDLFLEIEAGDDLPDLDIRLEEMEIQPGCGDGTREEGEECDDGNFLPGDGCEPDCRFSCHEDGDCDDGNQCTFDSCEANENGKGCRHEYDSERCRCEDDEDCAPFEDGDMCNGILTCVDNQCLVNELTIVFCPQDEECKNNLCNPGTGLCYYESRPDDEACDDRLFCTLDEACLSGECIGVPEDCRDANICTDDVCNESLDICEHRHNTNPCIDGLYCTVNDTCAGGTCTGDPLDCDDGDDCTRDSCDEGLDACRHEYVPTVMYTAVTGGIEHTCAITSGGGVRCWGSNWAGQLGNGTNTASNIPVDVSGLSSGVIAIAGGGFHTCALTSAGGVKCWGYNDSGQLGNGTTTSLNIPVDVSGLAAGATAIAAGFYHTCAVAFSGGAKCWGYNGSGQLGNGTTTSQSTPAAVSGLSSGVIDISADHQVSCALTSAGGVKCWGCNGGERLGDGTDINRDRPVDVLGLSSGVVAIEVGKFVCAVLSGGGVKCWGRRWGSTPTDVSGLATVMDIVTGAGYVCALLSSGGMQCLGCNRKGQIGNGTNTPSYDPLDVSGLSSGVVAIGGGKAHVCAVLASGAIQCWGENWEGQLGNGTNINSPLPVYIYCR